MLMKTSNIIFLVILAYTIACKDEDPDRVDPCNLKTPEAHTTIFEDSIVIVLNTVEGASEYFVNYRNANVMDGSLKLTKRINDTTFYLRRERVYPGTQYKLEVTAINTSPPYGSNCVGLSSNGAGFVTPCGPFRGFEFLEIKSTSVIVSWYLGNFKNKNDGDISPFKLFTLNVREKGSSDVTLNSTDDHYVNLTDLSANTDYEVQLVYTCSDDITYLSEWIPFYTL